MIPATELRSISHAPHLTISTRPFLATWLPQVILPIETAAIAPTSVSAWIASIELARYALKHLPSGYWTLLEIADVLEQANIKFDWRTISTQHHPVVVPIWDSTVLAVIPHYRCEIWLDRCLRSLVNQTRPPSGIVVVDDASEHPPVDIVARFPTVTLLASDCNVGPYRLIQQVIETTNYWAYLFQDADDWSSCDRLEELVYAALTTGAELVGTQELRVFESGGIVPVCYPLDVNQALSEKPGHPLLHPTSLVTRDLVLRLGGFATGLRFSGDTEFLLRAALISRVVNISDFCYFRQHRSGSLTTDPATGLESLARQELLKQIKQQAIANRTALQQGQLPNLKPMKVGEPVCLVHLAGPQLQ